jgi:hypothetical protein
VATQLTACAEQVRADAAEAEVLAEQVMDAAEGKLRGGAPRLGRAILEVIEGGRA